MNSQGPSKAAPYPGEAVRGVTDARAGVRRGGPYFFRNSHTKNKDKVISAIAHMLPSACRAETIAKLSDATKAGPFSSRVMLLPSVATKDRKTTTGGCHGS